MKAKLALAMVVVLIPRLLPAEDAPDYKALYEEQKKRNDTLERRVSILEEKDKSAPYLETANVPENTLKFLKETDISGYVAASYFYNFNHPMKDPDLEYSPNTGRGFDVRDNQFMANKLMVKIQKSVDYDAFEWRAGYTAEIIFGQDAEFTQASGLSLGDQGDLLQALVEFNVPVGNGIKFGIGKCSTPLGYELTETELNSNWSPGNQWTLLVPFTHTGVSVSYQLTSQWEAQFMVNNGWDVVNDNNDGKSFIGRLVWTPNEKSSFTIIGFGGPEQDDNASNWRRGVDFVATHTCSPHISSAIQLDYGAEDGVDANGKLAEWCAAGAWLVYTPQVEGKWDIAFRGDWVKDGDGSRTSEAPALAPFPANGGQELVSLTLTVNCRPVEGLRLAPEIRWDRSTLDTAFDGHDDQFTIGMGAAYQF